ncbi:MAG: NYN domain-containing protein [Deltaproteobacteria bacterium]|jgi:hypothetical protein|nr:NYN domain-containing protein [Deltaproteobacteria bacterium]
MSRLEIEKLKNGAVRRRNKRAVGLFIDGMSLDRAIYRLEKKLDLGKLVTSLSEGLVPEISRYYTLVPYEDDARQFSFLSAVERSGLEVIAKRLPPKNVQRKVAMDVHMATDLMLFATGNFLNHSLSQSGSDNIQITDDLESRDFNLDLSQEKDLSIKRTAIVLCPSRELSYVLYVCRQFGVEIMLVDFGSYGKSDSWHGIDKWVDLSTSETIWR